MPWGRTARPPAAAIPLCRPLTIEFTMHPMTDGGSVILGTDVPGGGSDIPGGGNEDSELQALSTSSEGSKGDRENSRQTTMSSKITLGLAVLALGATFASAPAFGAIWPPALPKHRPKWGRLMRPA
jgi:hypothetical protein